jgi:putative hemolysin
VNQALLELIFIPVLILLNGIFSLAEMAVVSSRKARLQVLADKGKGGARLILRILERPENFFSTIQIAITLISILTGVLSGAAAAEALAGLLKVWFPHYAHQAVTAAFVIVVFLVTYFSVVLGELVPKSLAIKYPEAIAVFLARPLGLVTLLFIPFSIVLSFSARMLLWLFGVRQPVKMRVTEEEIRMMIREGHETGSVMSSEKHMVENVFNLDDIPVVNLMTPRPALVWLDIGAEMQTNIETIRNFGHSYFPVAEGAAEKIIGVLPVRPLFVDMSRNALKDLRQYLIEPLFIPETMKAAKLLEIFKQTKKHFAIVTDEFGAIQGVATLHDILESIVGELPPLGSATEQRVRRRDDGTFVLDGTLPLVDFETTFGFALIDNTGAPLPFSTVAGFVAAELQSIVAEGKSVDIAQGRLEILDMDGPRVDKVLFIPLALRG